MGRLVTSGAEQSGCPRNSIDSRPLLVYASTRHDDQELYQIQHKLPKEIWLNFDFEDSHPDLPSLYLKGGSIIPLAPPYQHVDEANPTDDISLLVALEEYGKAEGFLFEDDGDGYEYIKGVYLVTTYVAELQSSMGTLTVLKTEGSWKRPNHHLYVQLPLSIGDVLDAWGTDGEIHSKDDLSKLKLAGERQYRTKINLDIVELQVMLTAESAKRILDLDIVPGRKGSELSRTPVEIKSGDWALKVAPWMGGRIISMEHLPSGTQWLHSRVDVNGYEEYSSVEYRSARCFEEYSVIKLVCLRVHPMFQLLHPTESHVSFTSIKGSKHSLAQKTAA
ncbi:heteroglycan glucosidase 1 [Abeliophyllum distichum]|uniref:Heteroglycan glucosidase 1 n=1 Tax=Abeliophyllum distichum TaxID=126358 RepID=A0ABD1P3U2_9LAMI